MNALSESDHVMCVLDDGHVWKEIPGYDGAYKVSDSGRVYSSWIDDELTQWTNDKGYKFVTLSKDGKAKRIHVARLVLIAFVGLPPDDGQKYDAAHWNGRKHDNSLGNLRWATHAANMRDNALMGVGHPAMYHELGPRAWHWWSKDGNRYADFNEYWRECEEYRAWLVERFQRKTLVYEIGTRVSVSLHGQLSTIEEFKAYWNRCVSRTERIQQLPAARRNRFVRNTNTDIPPKTTAREVCG